VQACISCGLALILTKCLIFLGIIIFHNIPYANPVSGLLNLYRPARRGHPLSDLKALGWMRQGVDFADVLHLAKAEGCEPFISFDQDFAKAANAVGGIRVRTP
jgi:hypothetical protein